MLKILEININNTLQASLKNKNSTKYNIITKRVLSLHWFFDIIYCSVQINTKEFF